MAVLGAGLKACPQTAPIGGQSLALANLRPVNLDQFIANKGSLGQYDSIGSFTISGQKALEKLAKHTLVEHSQWILKMVQGAVAGSATKLEIKQLRQGTQIDFHFPQAPDCEHFQRGILDPRFEAEPAVRELILGLRVLLLKQQLILEWDHGTALVWNGAQFDLCEKRGRRIAVPFRLFVKNTRVGGVLLSAKKARTQMLDEIQQLQKWALYAPLEIVVDGQPIHFLKQLPATSNPKRDHCRFSPRNLCAGSFSLSGEGAVELAPEPAVSANGFLRDSLRAEAPFLVWPAPGPNSEGHFGIFVSYAVADQDDQEPGFLPLTETFQIVWTRLGVVCAVANFPYSGFGGCLQLKGDHLGADLSGLNLQTEGESKTAPAIFQDLTDQLLPPLLESITNHQSRLDKKDLMEGVLSLGIAGGVTGYVTGAALLQLTSGASLVMAAAGGAAGASMGNRDLPNVKGWLCRHLTNSRQQLLEKMVKSGS